MRKAATPRPTVVQLTAEAMVIGRSSNDFNVSAPDASIWGGGKSFYSLAPCSGFITYVHPKECVDNFGCFVFLYFVTMSSISSRLSNSVWIQYLGGFLKPENWKSLNGIYFCQGRQEGFVHQRKINLCTCSIKIFSKWRDLKNTEWRDQKISSRSIPRPFFETKIFETETETFYRD